MTEPTPLRCAVYRCAKQSEMYLYLREGRKTDELPAPLLQRMGRLTHVMDLALTPARKLARADTARVLEALHGVGYYLQMPPQGHLDAHLYEGD